MQHRLCFEGQVLFCRLLIGARQLVLAKDAVRVDHRVHSEWRNVRLLVNRDAFHRAHLVLDIDTDEVHVGGAGAGERVGPASDEFHWLQSALHRLALKAPASAALQREARADVASRAQLRHPRLGLSHGGVDPDNGRDAACDVRKVRIHVHEAEVPARPHLHKLYDAAVKVAFLLCVGRRRRLQDAHLSDVDAELLTRRVAHDARHTSTRRGVRRGERQARNLRA